MKGLFLQDLAHLMGVSFLDDCQVSGYQIDSREVCPGDLFFALKGARVDGHQFLSEVAQKGAVAAVVSQQVDSPPLRLLVVPDVLASLQGLAGDLLRRYRAPVLGITGSVGKTTVKEFAATLLEGKFRVGKNPLNYNSQITCPLSLLNRSPEHELLVLEMGMSAPGEIAALAKIAPPEVAVLTQIALAHAQNFSDGLRGIARAKAEIFSQAATRLAILDAELMNYVEIREALPRERLLVSMEDSSADLYLSYSEGRFLLDEWGVRVAQFDLPFKEKHFIKNALLAMAAARSFGMAWEEIVNRIPELTLPKMRFERFERGGVVFINDAYNANPASMRAALEHFPEPKEGGKRIAVLGTMKELGAFSAAAHEEMGRVAQKHADLLLCMGEEVLPLFSAFQEAKKPAEFFHDHASLAKRLAELTSPGDVVLMKASRGMEFEKILERIASSHAASIL